MTFTSIISAVGNNNSIYPLIVRDCGIEVPSKILLTYNQNKKESKAVAKLAARERFFDEYATSAVWLGGIPLVDGVCNYFIKKKGFNPDVNLKLFKEDDSQGIDLNINKFKGKVSQNIIDDLEKVKANKGLYEKFLSAKFIASTAIPVLFMGFILPKLIFASSAKKIAAQRAKEAAQSKDTFDKSNSSVGPKNPSFKGGFASTVANFSTVNKMAVTDGGYAVGRVATARNKNERLDISFKMLGMMFLNFVAPKYIEKFFNKLSGLQLDPLILEDEEFLDAIKNKALNLPKTDNPKELLEYIDNNPKSFFAKYAEKSGKIKFLENGVRDPRCYVDTKDLLDFRNNINDFVKKAIDSGDVAKYAKNSKIGKSLTILANVGISSALLAYVLPKAQFAFRKVVTGSDLEPGLAPAEKILDNNKEM